MRSEVYLRQSYRLRAWCRGGPPRAPRRSGAPLVFCAQEKPRLRGGGADAAVRPYKLHGRRFEGGRGDAAVRPYKLHGRCFETLRAANRFVPRRQGFSLIEMIVAMAIMATAIIGLLTLTSVSLSNAAVIREYDRAAMLARSKMSELLEVHPLPLGQMMAGAFDDSTRWQARAEPFDVLPPVAIGRRMLVRVDLTVHWVEREREKFVQIEGYRTLRIREEHEGFLGAFR